MENDKEALPSRLKEILLWIACITLLAVAIIAAYIAVAQDSFTAQAVCTAASVAFVVLLGWMTLFGE